MSQIQVNYLHIIGEQQVEIMVLKEHIRQLEARLTPPTPTVEQPTDTNSASTIEI